MAFSLKLRTTPEHLSKEIVDEGCATNHRLKWGPLLPNEFGRIAQQIKKEGKAEGARWETSSKTKIKHNSLNEKYKQSHSYSINSIFL